MKLIHFGACHGRALAPPDGESCGGRHRSVRPGPPIGTCPPLKGALCPPLKTTLRLVKPLFEGLPRFASGWRCRGWPGSGLKCFHLVYFGFLSLCASDFRDLELCFNQMGFFSFGCCLFTWRFLSNPPTPTSFLISPLSPTMS